MALKNRTEAKAVVNAWAAVLDLELTHKPDLKDEILDNCLFRKDVANSGSGNGLQSIDFTDIDYYAWDATGAPTTLTLSGISQGEIKFLKVTKDANDALQFSPISVVLETDNTEYITSQLTEILFAIYNKDGSTTHVIPLTNVNGVDADEDYPGIIEIATTAEAQGLSVDNRAITPAKLADVNGGILRKYIEIGDWDMVTNATIPVAPAHGLTYSKIIGINAIIRNDADSARVQLACVDDAGLQGGQVYAALTSVTLKRRTSGFFDNAAYSTTSYNRGWIVIDYIV